MTQFPCLQLPAPIYEIIVIGDYLYLTLTVAPNGRVYKINLTTFEIEASLSLTETAAYGMATDGTYLYVGGVRYIHRITLATFTELDNLDIGVGTNGMYSLHVLSGKLYAGGYLPCGTVFKIDLATFTIDASLVISAAAPPLGTINAITSNGAYLYVTTNVSGAKFCRIDIATFTEVLPVLNIGVNVYCLYGAAECLYCATSSDNPGTMRKVDYTSWTVSETLTFQTGERTVYALVVDKTFFYCGCYTTPGRVIQVNRESFKRETVFTYPSSQNGPWGLGVSGDFLYAGTYNTPATLYKIDLRPEQRGPWVKTAHKPPRKILNTIRAYLKQKVESHKELLA